MLFAVVFLLTPFLGAEDAAVVPLNLAKAMRRTAEVQLGVVRSRERLNQAVYRAEEAHSYLLPRVDAAASQFRQTRNLEAQGITIPRTDPLVGPFNSFDARVSASMPLFDWEARNRFKQAGENKTLALEDQKWVRQDAMLMGASVYLAAKRAESARRAADARVTLAVANDKIAASRYSSGAGSRLERDSAHAQRTAAEARAVEAAATADKARRDLCVTLQYASECVVQFQDDDSFQAVADSTGAVEWPDLRRAQLALAERKANEQASAAARLPRVSVAADYGASGKDPGDVEATYSYGAKASLPIYQGGRLKAEKLAAESAVKESEAAVRDAELRSQADVATNRAAAAQREADWRARQEDDLLAQAQLRSAEESHRVGAASAVQLVSAQTQAIAASDAVAAAEAAYQISILEWARSEGRLEEFMSHETK